MWDICAFPLNFFVVVSMYNYGYAEVQFQCVNNIQCHA